MSVRTPVGVLSFPRVFAPRAASPGAEPRYSVNLLFDETAQKTPEFQALRKAVAQAIDEKFGAGKSTDKEFVSRLRSPFRKCSEKEYAGYKEMSGGVYINAWSQTKPGVVDARLQDITVPTDIWAGQLARATVRAFGYHQSGNMGVSWNLNNLQICRTDTPRLDGRREASDDFDTFGDTGMAMADDEVPFLLVPGLYRRAA